MKKLFFSMILGSAILFVSCSKDDPAAISTTALTATNVNTVATGGLWHVSSFIDNGQDKTNDLNGYLFKFDANYVLTASNRLDSTSYAGSWSTGRNESSSTLSISFPTSLMLAEINDNWQVTEMAEKRMLLSEGNKTLLFEWIMR